MSDNNWTELRKLFARGGEIEVDKRKFTVKQVGFVEGVPGEIRLKLTPVPVDLPKTNSKAKTLGKSKFIPDGDANDSGTDPGDSV